MEMLDGDFQLGSVHIAASRNLLIHGSETVSLEPRIMEVLVHLARHAPEVVSRDNLLDDIWKVQFGGDESLTRAISVLRKSFKSIGFEGSVIETIPKRGYRLAIEPQAVTVEEPPASASDEPSLLAPVSYAENTPTDKTFKGWKVALGIGVTAILVLALVWLQRPDNLVATDSEIVRTEVAAEEKERVLYMRLARSNDASEYIRGFEGLEQIAKTADEWQVLAELAYNKDTTISLSAIRNALRLEPDNFRLMGLHAQVLSIADRPLEARKAAEALKIVASSTQEKLTAAKAYLNIIKAHGNIEEVRKAIKELNLASSAYEAASDLTLPANEMPGDVVDKHPVWILAVVRSVEAYALWGVGEYDTALTAFEDSTELFKQLETSADSDTKPAIFLRQFSNHESRAALLMQTGTPELAAQDLRTALELLDRVDAYAPLRVDIRRPDTLVELGHAAFSSLNMELALDSYNKAIAGYEALLNKNPNHNQAYEGLSSAKTFRDNLSAQLK